MAEIEKSIDNLQFHLKVRGMKPKEIRPSYLSFYNSNSNSNFYEKPIKLLNNNINENPMSYSLRSKNTNLSSKRTFMNLNQTNRSNTNIYKPKIMFFEENSYNTNESFRNENNASFRNTNNTILSNNRYNNYNENTINENEEYYFEPLYGSYEYDARKLIEHELGPYVNNVRNKMKVEINEFNRSIKDLRNKTNEVDSLINLVKENDNKINEVMVDMDYMNRSFNNTNRQFQENIEITKKKFFDLEKNIYELDSNYNNLKYEINKSNEKGKKFEQHLQLILNELEKVKSKNNNKDNKFEEIIKSQIIDIQNISGNNEEISKIINNINEQINNIKEDMNNLNKKIEGENFDAIKKKSIINSNNNINDIYKQLDLLKKKNQDNTKRLNKINEEINNNDFEIPKESLPQTEFNENENKITKSDIKKIGEFENTININFEKYRTDLKKYTLEQNLFTEILIKNIEVITNEIMTLEKQIPEDEEIFENNLIDINTHLSNNNFILNQFNELKQDIQDIKLKNNMIEELKKRLEILESKI